MQASGRRLLPLILFALTTACGTSPGVQSPSATTTGAEAPMPRRLRVGDVAPGGTLRTVDGSTVELDSYWQDQLSVVVFYRGAW